MKRLHVSHRRLESSIKDNVLRVIFKNKVTLFHAQAWHVGLFNGDGITQGSTQCEGKAGVADGNLHPGDGTTIICHDLARLIDPGRREPCPCAMLPQVLTRLSHHFVEQGGTKALDIMHDTQQHLGPLDAGLLVGVFGGTTAQGISVDLSLSHDGGGATTGVVIQALSRARTVYGAGGNSYAIDTTRQGTRGDGAKHGPGHSRNKAGQTVRCRMPVMVHRRTAG